MAIAYLDDNASKVLIPRKKEKESDTDARNDTE